MPAAVDAMRAARVRLGSDRDLDVLGLTASLTHNRRLRTGNWQTTFAWGRNKREYPPLPRLPDDAVTAILSDGEHLHTSGAGTHPTAVPVQMALLFESAATVAHRHTLYTRGEYVDRDELFPPQDARHAMQFRVGRATGGYVYDLRRAAPYRIGVGVNASVAIVPGTLHDDYGSPRGVTVFARLRL